jgi:hypothetical protein
MNFWRREACLFLEINRRVSGRNEYAWSCEEARRKRECEEYEIPFISYPWPGKGFEVGCEVEEVPGNKEAIKDMI